MTNAALAENFESLVQERDALRRAIETLQQSSGAIDIRRARAVFRRKKAQGGSVAVSLLAALAASRVTSADAKDTMDFASLPTASSMDDLLAAGEACDPVTLFAEFLGERHDHNVSGIVHEGHDRHSFLHRDPFASRLDDRYGGYDTHDGHDEHDNHAGMAATNAAGHHAGNGAAGLSVGHSGHANHVGHGAHNAVNHSAHAYSPDHGGGDRRHGEHGSLEAPHADHAGSHGRHSGQHSDSGLNAHAGHSAQAHVEHTPAPGVSAQNSGAVHEHLDDDHEALDHESLEAALASVTVPATSSNDIDLEMLSFDDLPIYVEADPVDPAEPVDRIADDEPEAPTDKEADRPDAPVKQVSADNEDSHNHAHGKTAEETHGPGHGFGLAAMDLPPAEDLAAVVPPVI
ncbi:MAG: hypothetical protein AAGD92_09055 [Pseudomonadota bacterium]